MNNNQENTTPRVLKSSKNKIRVDFERTSLKERMKAKYLNSLFYKKLLVAVFRFILLLGISYIILFPFFSKWYCSLIDERKITA